MALPQVYCVGRHDRDHLIILATDGLWDVFTSEEAHEWAWHHFDKELSKGKSPQVCRLGGGGGRLCLCVHQWQWLSQRAVQG